LHTSLIATGIMMSDQQNFKKLRIFIASPGDVKAERECVHAIADAEALWLIDQIIDGSNPQAETNWHFPGDDLFTPLERRRGLPIGNLTSQFFANIHLNAFHHL